MTGVHRRGMRRTDREVDITFDGEPLRAVEGESLGAALTAAGKLALRHDKDGISHGLYCGMGACFECLVTVDGRASQRACLTKVAAGMRVESQPDRVPLSDPEARALTSGPPGQIPVREVEILVLGAGPAGLAAAREAASMGAEVVVVDERPQPGGQFYKQPASARASVDPSAMDRQSREGRRLIEEVAAAGVEFLSQATVWGAFPGHEIGVIREDGATCFRASQIILATGACERPVPVPGWTLPGVMMTGAAQTLQRSYGVAPGQRVLVAGNGPLNLQVAAELTRMGCRVVAVAETAPPPGPGRWRSALAASLHSPSLMADGAHYLATLMRARVPVLYRHVLVEAKGEGRVERAAVARMDGTGRAVVGTERWFEVDTVCTGYGFLPAVELSRLLGCRHRCDATGALVAERDANGETDIPGLFVAGDCGGIEGARAAIAQGALAGHHAARNLGRAVTPEIQARIRGHRRALARHRAFQRALRDLFSAPPPSLDLARDDTVICRCEGVTAGDLRRLVAAGVTTPAEIKKRTRAGMGRCQGRTCGSLLVRMCAEATGRPPDEFAFFAPRTPVKPLPALAVASEKPEWVGHPQQLARAPDVRGALLQDSDSLETDVLVIGAGILGVATAYFLARAGREVLLVDRGEANGQASGLNAGSLHVQLISYNTKAVSDVAGTPAADALPLGPAAVALWRKLAATLGENIEFKSAGGVILAEDERQLAYLREKAKLERACGLDVEIVSRTDLQRLAPAVSERMIGGEWCSQEGKINPLLATPALLARACAEGARLVTHTEVRSIERHGSGFEMRTNRGSIRAARVVNAAGVWASRIAALAGFRLPVVASPIQMIATEPASPVGDLLFAHAGRHLTLKQAANGNVIVGGAWRAGFDETTKSCRVLRESIEGNVWVAERVLPLIGRLHIIRTWAGLTMRLDGAPVVGEVPGMPGFFNAVSINGYTLGPLLGQLTAELIVSGKTHRDIARYAIERLR